MTKLVLALILAAPTAAFAQAKGKPAADKADAAQFTQIYRLAARHLASVTGRLVAISDRETLIVQGSSAAIVDRAAAGLR